MRHRSVTRSQTAIKEVADAYNELGFGSISNDEMELLRRNPRRVHSLMNQIRQQSQQPHQVVTRSRSPLEKLAKRYLALGFDKIPEDELRMLGTNAALVGRLIKQIAELEQIQRKLSLTPYVSRDPIIGHLVGYEYQKLINEFKTLVEQQQQQQSMGGKKRFRKSHKNSKKIKSKKSNKNERKKTYKNIKSKS